MQSSTKSFTCPSRVVSVPPEYLKLADMQQAPISKKRAESASRTSLQRMTLHLDHFTKSIMMRKFPTKKMISTGKAIMEMIWYQCPSQMTRRKPIKPKEEATCVRKMLSSRTQRLNTFQLSLQSVYVVMILMKIVTTMMVMDMYPFTTSSLVNTSGMFWKETEKQRMRLRRQRSRFCSDLEVISSFSFSFSSEVFSMGKSSLFPFFRSWGTDESQKWLLRCSEFMEKGLSRGVTLLLGLNICNFFEINIGRTNKGLQKSNISKFPVTQFSKQFPRQFQKRETSLHEPETCLNKNFTSLRRMMFSASSTFFFIIFILLNFWIVPFKWAQDYNPILSRFFLRMFNIVTMSVIIISLSKTEGWQQGTEGSRKQLKIKHWVIDLFRVEETMQRLCIKVIVRLF